ncbi:HD domain-containing protein [Streptomyces sp. PRB2-1]|uniref:HD domain-containing protein n=1 Tax=Actinacidiphila epipremni TaxID=2053013 RepID=A0ABX0ZKV3_9ACTN|nr:HD domain-containing protein [Actinacidiphila epipremni]
MHDDMVEWASRLAQAELFASLPRRWVHSQGVAARASALTCVVGRDSGLLRAAAVLHDVGYAPRLAIDAEGAVVGAQRPQQAGDDGGLVAEAAVVVGLGEQAEEGPLGRQGHRGQGLRGEGFGLDGAYPCHASAPRLRGGQR